MKPLLIAFICAVLLIGCDWYFGGDDYLSGYKKKSYGSKCDFVLPEGYSLRKNNSGEFAIGKDNTVLEYSTRYKDHFWQPNDIENIHPNPVRFPDSCSAVHYLYQYLRQIEANKFR